MWPKLSMFKPDVLPKGAKILYVDVDIAAVGDLSVLFDMIVPEKVQIIRDWKTYHEQWFPKLFPSNRTGNSSVLGFVAGENTDIWDRFVADPEGSFETLTNDQIFISEVAKSVEYLPEDLIGSFKKTVAPLPPLSWFSGWFLGHLAPNRLVLNCDMLALFCFFCAFRMSWCFWCRATRIKREGRALFPGMVDEGMFCRWNWHW